jgi:hypothetical protein
MLKAGQGRHRPSQCRSSRTETATMAKVTISIPHLVMREQEDGTYRPRFVPGPALRKMGYQGRDLRSETGNWYTLEQARDFARQLQGEIADRRAAKAAGKRMPRPKGPAALILQTLFDEFFSSAQFAEKAEVGRYGVKRLAQASKRYYAAHRRALETFDPEIMAVPVAALRKAVLRGLFEQIAEARGIHTARGVIVTLSAVFGYAVRRDRIRENPAEKLRLPSPPPRIRVGSLAEMRQLIDAADAIGRPELGDSIMLALFTGQRQADRLALLDGRLVEGRLMFRQKKTGAVVAVPPAPQLVARLDAMRARRHSAQVQWQEVIVEEKTGRPFSGVWYRRLFATVRETAVAGIEGTLDPMASLGDFRDQDLRDTAVTWLATAGCTIPEICAITGHSEAHATKILKHYLARNTEQADSAIGKLTKWVEGKGGL